MKKAPFICVAFLAVSLLIILLCCLAPQNKNKYNSQVKTVHALFLPPKPEAPICTPTPICIPIHHKYSTDPERSLRDVIKKYGMPETSTWNDVRTYEENMSRKVNAITFGPLEKVTPKQ